MQRQYHDDRGKALLTALLLLLAFLPLHNSLAEQIDQAGQPALVDFAARLPGLQAQVPAVTAAAESSANRILAHPDALLHLPYSRETSLGDELVNRAGGLAIALPLRSRRQVTTPQDVVLLSVRAWETDGEAVLAQLATYRDAGWMTTLIASRAGAPDDLEAAGATFFLDNGAPNGTAAHGRINVLANTALAWMWCCEYVSGMTREGKVPGILISIGVPGGRAHNTYLQTPEGRLHVAETEVAIPAGELARIYLGRLHTLVADLASAPRQAQLTAAAVIAADYLQRGQQVVISGVGHLIAGEYNRDYASPFEGRRHHHVSRGLLSRHFKPGDLLVWIGYSGGVNSGHHNFGLNIEEAGLDVITCYTPDPRLDGPDIGNLKALAHIDQSWSIGDAEVRMTVPPGHMAPISGINGILILRMLDDEVARRLPAKAEEDDAK